MSNVITEGFATYGTGSANQADPAGLAMLAGIWASGPDGVSGNCQLGTLPWTATDPSIYLASAMRGSGSGGWRRVLPVAQNDMRFSFYYACSALPLSTEGHILDFRNASNQVMAQLWLLTTGALALQDANGNVLAATAGPVVVPQSAVQMECKINISAQTFQLYVAGTQVINGAALVFSNPANVAQFSVIRMLGLFGTGATAYMSHLIVRDANGTYNNTFPIGDRKVATLLPNNDDVAHQGWTGAPLKKFGTGILDLTPAGSFVTAAASTQTDIGANDFTIEGEFRFQALPTGSNKAVLFGKWDEPANKRSYELYLGGPTLETGFLVFRTSTDGTNGTVVEKLKLLWQPEVGRYYHVAMCRASGNLMLFIDGVQQGVSVADADTYYAGTALPSLGGETTGSSGVANTYFNGWVDEFRFTKGISRYNANFAPPSAAFPRGGGDANWGSVIWLSSWDNAVVADDGPLALTLASHASAAAITPNDGAFNYQTINKKSPFDATFIKANLVAATGVFTMTSVPANGETVRLGTKDGTNAAVYTFKTVLASAFDVLIGGTIAACMNNLIAAIIGGAGAGTTYGTGTTVNADASAVLNPSNQMVATALTPGTSGNSIASTKVMANGSWGAATLTGGQDIPAYSQFGFQRMPSGTTVVDSITFANRMWKTDAGPGSVQISLVGGGGGVGSGAAHAVATTPTTYFDVVEQDPDTSGPLSPTTILNGKMRVNRTV